MQGQINLLSLGQHNAYSEIKVKLF